jgi:DHA1 family multidrug resistance protein-like MFS transporter
MRLHWLRNRITGHMLWQNPNLGSAILAVMVVYLGIGSILPVLTIYAENRGISVAEIGYATSAYMLANFIFLMPMGWLSDRIGRKPLMIFGLIVHVIISLLYLGMDDAPTLMFLRFLDGFGGAAVWPAARAYVMDTAPLEHRGQSIGLLGSAMMGGIMIGPAIGGFLGGTIGFGGPFWFGAITGALSAVFLFFAIKGKTRAQVTQDAVPVDEIAGNALSIKWLALLPVAFIAAGGGVANGLFSALWNVWMNDLGASPEVIGLSYTVFALPVLVVSPWAGRLADRHNRIWLIVIPTLVAASVYLSYAFLTSIPVIIGLGIIEGAALAFLGPTIDSYFADIVPARLRGRAQGVTSSVNTAVAFVAASGLALIYQGNHGGAFLVVAGATTFATLAAAVLMAPHEARLRPRNSAAPHAEAEAELRVA